MMSIVWSALPMFQHGGWARYCSVQCNSKTKASKLTVKMFAIWAFGGVLNSHTCCSCTCGQRQHGLTKEAVPSSMANCGSNSVNSMALLKQPELPGACS